jgi:hypothetical protein
MSEFGFMSDFGFMRSAIAAAIAHDRYLARARAVGISHEVAEAELAAVRAEVSGPTTCATGAGDEHNIAWHRLISGGPAYRPGDQVRAALRKAFPTAHPEWIDQVAHNVAPDETLAKELLPPA